MTGDPAASPDDRVRWHVLADPAALAAAAAAHILAAADRAIADRGEFRLVLAGGATPGAVYRKLAASGADWPRWRIWYGDERCLPPADPGRNSRMAGECWLDGVAIPPGNVHVIPAERGPGPAARAYAAVVADALPFDLVLLGMGEDGHTASLFPGREHDPRELAHAVHDAPKPPPGRVSLGMAALNDTRELLVLVSGDGKHAAVARWRGGADLPVARLHGRRGVDVYLDAAAHGGAPGGRDAGGDPA